MSQRREKQLRQLERRVAALEAKMANGMYYWTESAEHEREIERIRWSPPEFRLAMSVDGSGGGGIFRRIVDFFSGR